jgi:hypothetical protein
MGHRCARKGELRVNSGIEWVTQLLERERQVIACPYTTTLPSSGCVSWHPRRFEWTTPFHSKTETSFCAIVIMFRTSYTRDFRPGGHSPWYSLTLGELFSCSELLREKTNVSFLPQNTQPFPHRSAHRMVTILTELHRHLKIPYFPQPTYGGVP